MQVVHVHKCNSSKEQDVSVYYYAPRSDCAVYESSIKKSVNKFICDRSGRIITTTATSWWCQPDSYTNYGSYNYKGLQCTFNVNKIVISPAHLLSPYDIFSTITTRNYMHCFWQISKTKDTCFFLIFQYLLRENAIPVPGLHKSSELVSNRKVNGVFHEHVEPWRDTFYSYL